MITLYGANRNGNSGWIMKGKRFAQGCYLHGALEKMNGYDLFFIEEAVWDDLVKKGNGWEKVCVVLSNGKVVIASMYFWKPVDYEKYEEAKLHYQYLINKYKDYVPENVNENIHITHLLMNAAQEVENYRASIEAKPIRALVVLPEDKGAVGYAKAKQRYCETNI